MSAYKVIFSTPAPIPISIIPALILAAIIELDSNPEEQNLLITEIETVSGIPAKNCPILEVRQPAPIYKTFPTQISSIFFGSIPDLLINPFKTVWSITSAPVSLYGPFLALVQAVLQAATTTTSSAFFYPIVENYPAVLFLII